MVKVICRMVRTTKRSRRKPAMMATIVTTYGVTTLEMR